MPELTNIFLVGFSGVGKTSTADCIREKFDIKSYDLDRLIEASSKKTIRQIFDEDGEEQFRILEKTNLFLTNECKGIVLSCGGGAVIDQDNVNYMKRFGRILWLDASADIIYERICHDDGRPLIRTKSINEIKLMKQKRDEIYSNICDYRINTDSLTTYEAAEKVMEYYESINRTGQS